MSIVIKSKREVELMREAGRIVALAHEAVCNNIKPGVSTAFLDQIAEKVILENGAKPSFKGYNGFPTAVCASVNSVVVHGFPKESTILKEGDIVSIDIGACYKGYHGDSAWTYAVGKITKEQEYLMEHTEKSLYIGLQEIKPGNHIGDIGYAIETYAKEHHLGVIQELVGHGVGTSIHEEPDVPNYGTKHSGPVLKKGMVIAVEPMLTLGSPEICILDDDWTIETEDYSMSAHYEHTVVVTENGYEILTGGKNGQK